MNDEQQSTYEHADTSDYLDYFDDDQELPKVSRDIALADFHNFLTTWKIKKQNVQKGRRDKEKNESTFNDMVDAIIQYIMDGTLVVDKDAIHGVKLVHNLYEPINDIDTLEYRKIPKIKDLRKADGFAENEDFAQAQGYAAAMSGKDIGTMGNLSMMDLRVITTIMYFFR